MVGLTDDPDGSSTDHGFLSIHKYLFGIILFTHQNEFLSLKIIVKNISLLINKDSQDKRTNKTKKTNYIMGLCNNFQRKRQKTVADQTNHSLNDFNIIVVYPSTSMTSCEKGFSSNFLWAQLS